MSEFDKKNWKWKTLLSMNSGKQALEIIPSTNNNNKSSGEVQAKKAFVKGKLYNTSTMDGWMEWIHVLIEFGCRNVKNIDSRIPSIARCIEI